MSKAHWKIEKAMHSNGQESNCWYCFYCIINGEKEYAETDEPIFLQGINQTMDKLFGNNRFVVCYYSDAQTVAKLLNGGKLTDKQKERVDLLVSEYQLNKIIEKYKVVEIDEEAAKKIKLFKPVYYEMYDKLYEADDEIDYSDETYEFDARIKNDKDFKTFVCQFCRDRQDLIASDREAAAFVMAYRELNLDNATTPDVNTLDLFALEDMPEDTEAAAIIDALETENARIDNFANAASALGLTVKTKGETTNDPIVWVTGDTKPHKDWLKAQGARWCAKKTAWYFHPNRVRSRAAA